MPRLVQQGTALKALPEAGPPEVNAREDKTQTRRRTVKLKSKVLIAASRPLSPGLRRPRPAETLFAVSKAVGSRQEIAEVLRETTRELVRALAADIGSVWRLDPSDHELRPVADYGALPKLRAVSLNTSLVSVLLKNPAHAGAGAPVYSSNSATDPRFDHPLLRLIPHRSLLIQPFRNNGRSPACFAFMWTRSRHRFNDVELRLVEAVTQQAGIAIENAELLDRSASV